MLIKENILIKNSEKLNRRLTQASSVEQALPPVGTSRVPPDVVREEVSPKIKKTIPETPLTPLKEEEGTSPVNIASIQTVPNLDQSNYVVGFN